METMIKKFCKKYKLPETLCTNFCHTWQKFVSARENSLSAKGERNSNFYLLKKGIWRAYYLTDGTENSLWFAAPGDTAFSSWGYVDSEVSLINIESVNESIAYCISKPELEALFSHSIDMANFGRRIFEREILSVDSSTVAYGTPPTAKERYMTLMEENPELLQDVPLKYLASYLYITPQSLSRIRAGLKKSKRPFYVKMQKRLLADYFCKSLFYFNLSCQFFTNTITRLLSASYSPMPPPASLPKD